MLLGIIVGGVMVILMSILMGLKIGTVESENEDLRKSINVKDLQLQQQDLKIAELGEYMNNLRTASGNMVFDYQILTDMLYEVMGVDKANEEFSKRKESQPDDINELLAKVKEMRKKHE